MNVIGPISHRHQGVGVRQPLATLQLIRPMRGKSRSVLALASDQRLWVIKFQDHPQSRRVLVNDYIGTRLAGLIGLSVPTVSTILVQEWLCKSWVKSLDSIQTGGAGHIREGVHFASQYAAGLTTRQVFDWVSSFREPHIENRDEFLGAAILDRWLLNTDRWQAILVRSSKDYKYKAVFIDHGRCFGGPDWSIRSLGQPLGPLPQGIDAFPLGPQAIEPWLARVEALHPSALRSITEEIPPEWYRGEERELERMLESVLKRRSALLTQCGSKSGIAGFVQTTIG